MKPDNGCIMHISTTSKKLYDEQCPFNFPKDHGAHVHNTEWWYVNGHILPEDSSHSIWFAFAFFKLRLEWPRVLTRLRSTSNFVYGYQAHGSVYSEKTDKFESATASSVFIPYLLRCHQDDLALKVRGNILERIAPHTFRLRSVFSNLDLDLTMISSNTMIHGVNGIIQMADKGESNYYSMPSMEAKGRLTCAGKARNVTGRTWLDHQWGNWQGSSAYWKWFCVQLSNRTQIMIYSFENKCENKYKTVVTLQEDNGRCFNSQLLEYRELDCYISENSGISYPTSHELCFEINNRRYRLIITALHKQQEIRSKYVDYWEGPCKAMVFVDKNALEGNGFCEIIGRYVYDTATREA